MQHFQQVGACDARTKKAVAVNFTDVRNLIADRPDLVYDRLKPLLSVLLQIAQTQTDILPNIRGPRAPLGAG